MDEETNAAMWGPPNAPQPGPLATWDLRPWLGGISVPTLVVAGRYDRMASGQERKLREGIPNSELVCFEESSHYPFVEERERFLTTLDDFPSCVEGQIGP